MKRYLLFHFVFLLVFQANLSRAASTPVDSTLIKESQELLSLSAKLLYQNPDTVIVICRGIVERTEATPEMFVRSQAYRFIGISYDVLGELEKSMMHYDSAFTIAQSIDDSIQMANLYLAKGIIHYRLNNYPKALELYSHAYEIYKRHDDLVRQSATLNNIGAVYNTMSLFEKARELYKREIELSASRKDSTRLSAAYGNLAHSYTGMDKPDSSLYYIKKSIAINLALGDHYGLRSSYQTLGVIYMNLNQLDSARKYMRWCIESDKSDKRFHETGTVYLTLAELESMSGNHNKALTLADSALYFSNSFGSDLDLKITAYRAMAKILASVGRKDEAIDQLEQALVYSDSLKQQEVQRLLLAFDLNLRTQNYKHQIQLAEEAQQQLSLENKQKNLWLTILIVGLVSLTIIIIALYKARIANKKYLGVLDEQNKTLTETLRNSNQMLSILAHDFRSPLTAIFSIVDFIVRDELSNEEKLSLSAKVKKNITATLMSIDQLLVWISRDKKIVTKESINLEKSIEEVKEMYDLESSEKHVEVRCLNLENKVISFDPSHFGVIARNLIHNSLKFTPAGGMITIACTEMASSIEVVFEDNGQGISPDVLAQINEKDFKNLRTKNRKTGYGLGLEVVFDLVKMNGADIRYESELGKGTRAILRLDKG